MQKMWISLIAMGLMALAMLIIYISRYKLNKRFLKVVTALAAWACMIMGGLLMLYVVLTGPTY
jgi:O-antigen/teichoic acid export membrane protein